MGKSLKKIADEIGVSKQAVYKRLKGKLKSVCAPYVYTEYNRTCLTEEGEAIIKKDFEENPCATPLFSDSACVDSEAHPYLYGANTEQSGVNTSNIRNTYVQNPYSNTERTPNSNTERIENAYETNMEQSNPNTQNIHNSYVQNPYTHTEHIDTAYEAHMEQSKANPSDIRNTYIQNPYADTECTGSTYGAATPADTEHTETAYGVNTPNTDNIQSTSVSDTEAHTDMLQLSDENEALKEKIHQMEIELVKANAEIENRNVRIEHLQERISDKDKQIAEQKENITRIDSERKVLTASLFKNNEFIEELMKLPLSKRIFGWNQVQKRLKDTRNSTESHMTNENAMIISVDNSENDD